MSEAEANTTQKAPTNATSTPSKGPGALPQPFVTRAADDQHAATIVMLHGFTSSGKAFGSGWVPTLRQQLGAKALGRLRIVWLNAPTRTISCYGDEMPRHPAWHDYLTDHGGDEGHPEIEEEIDVAHLEWSRARIHEVIDAEARALGGDYGRVAVGGASQGACMAIDVALTHARGAELAGVFASCGQVYSCTPVPSDRPRLRLSAFHGCADPIIGANLALRSYAKLIDSGFREIRVGMEPGLGHCEPSDAEGIFFAEAIKRWGLLEAVPLAEQPRTPSSVTRKASSGKGGADQRKGSASKSMVGGERGNGVAGAIDLSEGAPGEEGEQPVTPVGAADPLRRGRRSRGSGGGGGGGGGDGGETAAASDVAGGEGGPAPDLDVVAAWYGDAESVWSLEDGEGGDVTAEVRRLVKRGELKLNEKRAGGWYNSRFSDTAPGTWKVVAVKYRYGDGALQQVVTPPRENEKASLIITPTKTAPRPTKLRE